MAKKCKASDKLKGCTLSAEFRAEENQFRDNFYEDGGQLFCSFCQHTVDWTRRGTCVDHLKSKKAPECKGRGFSNIKVSFKTCLVSLFSALLWKMENHRNRPICNTDFKFCNTEKSWA